MPFLEVGGREQLRWRKRRMNNFWQEIIKMGMDKFGNQLFLSFIFMDPQDSQDLKTIFDSFDIDKNGTIEIKEIQKIAQKLGEPLPSTELDQIMDLLDTNGDKKISYSQFQYWWKKGKKGKLMKLVELKAKSLKLTNFVKNKFNDANIGFEGNKKLKPDVFDFKVSFGSTTDEGVNINFDYFIQGEQKQMLESLKKINDSVTPQSIGILMKIPSQEPAHAKISFDEIVNDIVFWESFPLPMGDLHDNQFFTYTCDAMDDCIVASFLIRGELITASQPVSQGASAMVDGMGQEFYGKLNLGIKINSSIDAILESPIHQNLLNGFQITIRTQANNSTFQKLRKLTEKQKMELPPLFNLLTLIRSMKLHWKLRTPEQVDKFLDKLGISEALEDMPVLSELLEGAAEDVKKSEDEFLWILKKVGRMGLRSVENKVQIYSLMGKAGTGRLKVDAKNITKFHSVIFNEF